jgi:hypothetical protein
MSYIMLLFVLNIAEVVNQTILNVGDSLAIASMGDYLASLGRNSYNIHTAHNLKPYLDSDLEGYLLVGSRFVFQLSMFAADAFLVR